MITLIYSHVKCLGIYSYSLYKVQGNKVNLEGA